MASQSLLDDPARLELLGRLARLDANAQRRWGKMNAAQMLAHCRVPIAVAAGEAQLKHTLVGRLFGRIAKRMVLGPGDMKPNLPTDKEFIVSDARDFELEREALKAQIERFLVRARAGKLGDTHPFFGPMSPAEWDRIQWKHLDHHLRQFGV